MLALLLALMAPAPDPALLTKKEHYLADKRVKPPRRAACCPAGLHLSEATCTISPACRPALRAGDRARAVVFARNLHTEEIMPWNGPVVLDRAALGRFLRCYATGEPGAHPEPLVRRVLATAEEFAAAQIHIISGYRHPKHNLALVKKGREAARDSQHTRSQAIDFGLPGVAIARIYKHLRKKHVGGVGYYPVSEFVHVDTGKRRTWKGT
jgi:uncharacterized protein YcbK (DUF882 family)